MNTRERLCNWGAHVGGSTGPATYPAVSPMFRDADMLKWHEDGWEDKGAIPVEEILPPVDIADAEIIDNLVKSIKSERLKMALLIEYASAPASFRWRRSYNYVDSVNEAFRLMEDMLTGQSKKAQILRLLAERGHSETRIAEIVGCSQPYVSQLKCAA